MGIIIYNSASNQLIMEGSNKEEEKKGAPE